MVFHHHGFFDEYVIIAAYKKDLDKRQFPITSYYFCDEKTATVMSGSLFELSKWATLMANHEDDIEVGIMTASELVEVVEQDLNYHYRC